MTDALILPLGIAIIALVSARLGVHTVAAVKNLRFQNRRDELSLQLLRQRIADSKNRASDNQLSWNGYRKFEIARRVEEARGICSFDLQPHDGKPLPSFKTGQYLTFRLQVPGREKPVVRCYSLSDCPRSDRYRVSIKCVPAPVANPQAPPGLVSNYFHEQLREGEILDVQAPRGQFFLDIEQERPCVLIAGGIGVTPILSMINRIVESGSGQEILLFYGIRNGREHAFRETLEQTVQQHANIRMVVAYSQPSDEDEKLEGVAYHHQGWVDLDLIRSYLQSTNYEFYLCGPPAMMETLNRDLLKWGVAQNAIKTEAFGPATVSQALTKTASAAKPTAQKSRAGSAQSEGPKIEFSRSGKTCHWNDDAVNLLDFADDNGIPIDSGCRAGNCGSCAIAIKSGKVIYLTEHGAELEEGTCLACIAAPDGDVILDA